MRTSMLHARTRRVLITSLINRVTMDGFLESLAFLEGRSWCSQLLRYLDAMLRHIAILIPLGQQSLTSVDDSL